MAGIAHLTGSKEAARAYRELLADAPPFTTAADYARDPTFSLSPPAAAETAALTIVLAGDSWQGDPEAVILLDGQEVFRGPITASRDERGVVIALGEVPLGEAQRVTVRFLNDHWGGSADTDRNLYIEDIRLDGISTGQQADLFRTGEVTLKLGGTAPPPEPVVVSPSQPPPGVPIRLGLSQDAWAGDARATVLLDGVVLTADVAVTASRAAGEVQHLELRAEMAAGPHTLTVRFLNDAWGGHAEADRNLHVESVSIGGADLRQSAALLWSGDAEFRFDSTPVPSIGSGPDTLRLGLSADSWRGDPHFLILVDGLQIGGVQSSSASHAAGLRDTLDIRGDFEAGQHHLVVRFLDDAWGGTAAEDRNLYVESLALNGVDLHQSATLYTSGDAVFGF